MRRRSILSPSLLLPGLLLGLSVSASAAGLGQNRLRASHAHYGIVPSQHAAVATIPPPFTAVVTEFPSPRTWNHTAIYRPKSVPEFGIGIEPVTFRRQQIKSFPILERPNRPFHVYGNAVRWLNGRSR